MPFIIFISFIFISLNHSFALSCMEQKYPTLMKENQLVVMVEADADQSNKFHIVKKYKETELKTIRVTRKMWPEDMDASKGLWHKNIKKHDLFLIFSPKANEDNITMGMCSFKSLVQLQCKKQADYIIKNLKSIYGKELSQLCL